MRIMIYLLLFLGISIWPLGSLAHGAGYSLEKSVGEYIVDIGYDVIKPRAGDVVRFDFALWNKNRTDFPEMTGVWFRIAPQNKPGIVLAGQLGIPEFGPVGISYAFPEAGSYDLTARYMNKDITLVEATFPFTVAVGTHAAPALWKHYFVAVIIGLVIGLLMGFIFFKNRTI